VKVATWVRNEAIARYLGMGVVARIGLNPHGVWRSS